MSWKASLTTSKNKTTLNYYLPWSLKGGFYFKIMVDSNGITRLIWHGEEKRDPKF